MSLENTPRTYCAAHDVKIDGAYPDSDFKRVVDAAFVETLERELLVVTKERDKLREAFQVPACVTDPQFIADKWRDQHSCAMLRLGEMERDVKALTNENEALRDAIEALHDAVEGKRFDDASVAELLSGAMKIPRVSSARKCSICGRVFDGESCPGQTEFDPALGAHMHPAKRQRQGRRNAVPCTQCWA